MPGFKTSLLGFRKKDVTKFTKELSNTYVLQLKEKDKELSALKEEIRELNKKIKDLEAIKSKLEDNINKKETEDVTDE